VEGICVFFSTVKTNGFSEDIMIKRVKKRKDILKQSWIAGSSSSEMLLSQKNSKRKV